MKGSAWIDGIALWSPRLAGWEAAAPILRGEAPPHEPRPRPAPALLAPTERRRAPDTVAIALEEGFAPGTLNARALDVACGPQIRIDNDDAAALTHVSSHSFGFGGNNCVLVFGKERAR